MHPLIPRVGAVLLLGMSIWIVHRSYSLVPRNPDQNSFPEFTTSSHMGTFCEKGGSCCKHCGKTQVEPVTGEVTYERLGSSGALRIQLKQGEKNLTDADLTIAHEKKMHLILAREDLKEYQHLHPFFVEGTEGRLGYWSAPLPKYLGAGPYRVFVDVTLQNGVHSVITDQVDTESVGNGIKSKLDTFLSISSVIGDPPVAMKIQTGIQIQFSQQRGMLNYVLRDAKTFRPVTVKPYLGALGHVVVLSHTDPKTYIHAHPQSEMMIDGDTVKFIAEGLQKGTYTAFAEFDVSGKLQMIPFTFDVKMGEEFVENENAPVDHAAHGM